jgi:hypothetical protein
MAASLLIEQESGTYTTRIRHSHNGYYAGDFSQTPRSGSELRALNAQRHDVRRAKAPYGALPLAAATAIPNDAEHRSQPAVRPLSEL